MIRSWLSPPCIQINQCTFKEENSYEDSGNIKKTNDYINSKRKNFKKHKRNSNDNEEGKLLKDKIDKIFETYIQVIVTI